MTLNYWKLALSFASIALGQAAYDVASIKLSGPQTRRIGTFTYPGGRVLTQNLTLNEVLEQAFNVESFQISGGPAWTHEIRYDIDARPPTDSKSAHSNPTSIKLPMNEEQRQMFQTLLAERFQLKVLRETQQGSVYLLTRTTRPLKLEPPKDQDGYPWAGSPEGGAFSGSGVAGTNITMPQLARRLGRYFKRPVLDRTGLEGAFDFSVPYAGGDDPVAADVADSLMVCLQKLGLKLVPGKAPIETIVIEKVERPTKN